MVTGDQANQSKKDTVRALDVGYEIHRAFTVGNFSQYTWWYIRRCYGLIMETDFSNKLSIPTNEVGKISKRGYVLSQFARFIRPGAVRISATQKPETNVYASAYKSKGGDSIIVVLINRDYTQNKTVTVNVPNVNVSKFRVYTTNETKNVHDDGDLEVINGSVSVTMNKDCIMTLVGEVSQVVIPQEPFGGIAAKIPGKIEAENYDITGSGKGNASYYDSDSENKGGAYRQDGVDIVAIDESLKTYALGYTVAGEWLEYTVNVPTAGIYQLTLNIASGSETSSLQFLVNDQAITDTIKIPKTDSTWNVYQEIDAGKVTLAAGEQILKMQITGSFVNVDWFEFSSSKAEKDSSAKDSTTAIFRRGNVTKTGTVQLMKSQKFYDLKGRRKSSKSIR